ncbi:MAG TPA: MerR family transcriptional regulator [Candidatus Sulfotelmatobacter sp.]|nr:MerR family transcriptional regulator [Candidatus Sulfotelmatobacter sp.]
MNSEFSLEELAVEVQAWTEKHQVFPANGQAAEEITERTIRYYRTLGLLDAPIGNYAKTFSKKHKLQLIAIRFYQSLGLPLRKIRDELYGKSEQDLAALERQIVKQGGKAAALAMPLVPPVASESWSAIPLAGNYLLISRDNQKLPRTIVDKINQLLLSVAPATDDAAASGRN